MIALLAGLSGALFLFGFVTYDPWRHSPSFVVFYAGCFVTFLVSCVCLLLVTLLHLML